MIFSKGETVMTEQMSDHQGWGEGKGLCQGERGGVLWNKGLL
jgi:hypothetical protein